MSEMTKKRMSEEDIEEVLNIEIKSFPNPWTRNMFEDELNRKNRIYFTARIAGEIMGYAGFYFIFNEAHITTLAVSREFRGKGHAKTMVKWLIEEAREIGLSQITLEVRDSNVIAQNLYKDLGFKKVGFRKDYYRKPLENGLIMTLKIEPKRERKHFLSLTFLKNIPRRKRWIRN